MGEFSPELKEFLLALEKKKKMTAMLAPSFPGDLPYPGIIGKLKRLGFAQVVEVARGAAEVNRQLLALLENNPNGRFITSPCPAVVRLIRTKYPHLLSFLAPIGSPMSETAKLVLRAYPGCRPVFIGPCLAKKAEAREDHPSLGILALTFQEIKKVLVMKRIKDDPEDLFVTFNITGPQTRLYPVSGGLSQSSGLNELLTDEEYDVVSGPKLAEETLREFPESKLRVLDILYCEGGCINGPGIASQEPLDKRRQKVLAYWAMGLR